MLLPLLLNLDFAAGEVFVPPPPIIIPSDIGSIGDRYDHFDYEKDEKEKRIREDDRFIKEFLMMATKILNDQ